jgi:integrase/recombinase XerD
MKANVSIILDPRRTKSDNTLPVKLRVYDISTHKAKLYCLNLDLSPTEFEQTWGNNHPPKDCQNNSSLLHTYHSRAEAIIRDLDPFTFDIFEWKMFQSKGNGKNIFFYFDYRIEEFKMHNKFSTLDIYSSCLKMMKAFCKNKTGNDLEYLPFVEVTPEWLQDFEDYMLKKNKSRTTVSIYTRAIQAVFNIAIYKRDITREIYPFGSRKYVRPSVKKVKKALSDEQLRTLLNCEAPPPYQNKARDFWFFSFATFGMNIKDILLLKWKDISEDKITYIRSKTENTAKKEVVEHEVYLTDISRDILNRYGTPNRKPNDYVFDILKPDWNEKQIHREIRNFTRFINQHIQILAKKNNLPSRISSYWARHSFATKSIREGYTMDMVGDAFKHSDSKVTVGYFAGLDNQSLKQMNERVTKL